MGTILLSDTKPVYVGQDTRVMTSLESGVRLNALSTFYLVLRMDDTTIQVAVGLLIALPSFTQVIVFTLGQRPITVALMAL